jgi:hypothetical protein
MNKNRLIGIGLVVSSLIATFHISSCTKIAPNLSLQLPMQTGKVNILIPATEDTINTLTFGTESIKFNVDSFIKSSTNDQFNGKNISSIKITECKITLNNPTPTNNLANFQSCSASMFSDVNQQPYTIALLENPDLYATTLNIPIQNDDLSSYIGSVYYYSVSGRLRKPTTTSLECTVSYTYNVIVKG